jgi:hypothetical protein
MQGLLIFFQDHVPKEGPIRKLQCSFHPVSLNLEQPHLLRHSPLQSASDSVVLPLAGAHRDRFTIHDLVSLDED